MIRRLRRRLSAALILTLLCSVGAGALCALPCATQPSHDGTSTATGTDHCASLSATTSGATVATSAQSCQDHDPSAPALERNTRRLNTMSAAELTSGISAFSRVLVVVHARLFAVPDTAAPPPLIVPLRI